MRQEQCTRVGLLENLLDHRDDPSIPLLVPPIATVGFMAVLEATQRRDEPLPIDPTHVVWHGTGQDANPVVDDVVEWQDRALAAGAPYAAVGAPWSSDAALHTWRPRTQLTELALADGTVVAEYADGTDISPLSSPRPYLHPIRTRGGVVVSDTHPADHDWHCGLSLTMQDVDGVNFWGGRTYVRDRGYTWLGDQGAITHVRFDDTGAARLVEVLRWHGPDPQVARTDVPPPAPVELREERELAWRSVGDATWRLDAGFALTPVSPTSVSLGGPGTNGRTDAGYGGFQLRLAPATDVVVHSALGSGEAPVYGRAVEWAAVSATFSGGRATVVMAGADERSRQDPWFVRTGEYVGLGSALAWRDPVVVSADEPFRRCYTVLVADGDLTASQIEALLAAP